MCGAHTEAPMQRIDPTWFAFLAMAFAVVGLAGAFASFAAPLPLHRALSRDAEWRLLLQDVRN